MILTGKSIIKEIYLKNIIISPFDTSNINPNSYDLSLGSTLCYYEENILDTISENNIITVEIPEEGYTLLKNKFYFAESLEHLKVKNVVPILHSKSGLARKGLFTHITADLLNADHDGTVLMQLYPSTDIIIHKYQKIGQVSFWRILDSKMIDNNKNINKPLSISKRGDEP